MKRTLIISLVAVLCSLSTAAQGAFRWLETEHDFGTFSEEQKRVGCKFRAVNEGDSTAIITNVVTTCGCTTSQYTQTPVAPGDTAVVMLQYHATGAVGTFSKKAFVLTNTAERKVTLTIRGNVLASENTIRTIYPDNVGALYMDSRNIPFGEVKSGASKMAYIGAYNNSADTIRVEFDHMPAHVTLEAFPSYVPPFSLCTISAFFNSFDCSQWGLVSDSIAISATPLHGDAAAQSTISVIGTIVENFDDWTTEQMNNAPIATIDTETLDFGTINPATERVSRTLRIGNAGRSTLPIRRIYSTAERIIGIDCSATEVRPGKSAEVTISLDVARIEGGFVNEPITIMTGDPIHPIRTVRVVGILDRSL